MHIGEMTKTWKVAVVVILGWLLSAAVQWGVVSNQLAEQNRRISNLEQKTFITRDEYEQRQKELRERLDRIENKIDRAIERRKWEELR